MAALINTRRAVRELTVDQVKGILQEAYVKGHLFKSDDGKYMIAAGTGAISPWHFVGNPQNPDCRYWHRFLGIPGLGKGESFIPNTCMNCWKVVIKPRTLKELFKLLDVMTEYGHRGKVGIERRETTFGPYGGYLYNETIEAGQECKRTIWRLVQKNIGKVVDLNSDEEGIKLGLKRGCTEYELAHGPSGEWKPYPGQLEVEEWVKNNFVYYAINSQDQTEESLALIHGEWLKFAYQYGDKTYREFSGLPIYEPYQTY